MTKGTILYVCVFACLHTLRKRQEPSCGSITLAMRCPLLHSLSSLRLWQCGSQDPSWAPLLCLLWSVRGATMPDVDQRPGQVLRGTCQEAGPVSHQERSEPGMSQTLDTELRGGKEHGRGGEVLAHRSVPAGILESLPTADWLFHHPTSGRLRSPARPSSLCGVSWSTW